MKIVVSLIFFLIISIVSNSQNCLANVWFKPGTVLEYKSYASKIMFGIDKAEFVEVTRLTFTVDDVDSSDRNRIYASITKSGKSVKKDYSYQKQVKVVCENGRVGFVPGHFLTDTVFNCDVPGPGRGKIAYTSSATGEMFFPFSSTRSIGLVLNVRARVNGLEVETKEKIRRLELLGEVDVNCPAGNYKCSKIAITAEVEVDKNWKPLGPSYIYYSKEVGIVRWENLTSYLELAKVTR